jgi:hypothetical protein
MAGRPWGSAGLLLHPRPEVLEPPLGDVDVGLREGAGALLQGMEKHEQVPRPLVQHAIQVPPVVTPQFPELAVDLGAVRKRERWVVVGDPIQQADLEVDLLLPLRGQAVQESR